MGVIRELPKFAYTQERITLVPFLLPSAVDTLV